MIISEDTSDCTGQGPAQNDLQVRKRTVTITHVQGHQNQKWIDPLN